MPEIPAETQLGAEEKRCPYCAEIIKKEAILCRYCRMDLRTNQPVLQGEPAEAPILAAEAGSLSDGGQVDQEVYRELAFEIQFGRRLYSGFFDQDGACERLLALLRHAPGDPKVLELWNMFWTKFQVLSVHPEWGLTATYQYVSEQLLSIAADALAKEPSDTNMQTLASSIRTNLGCGRSFVEINSSMRYSTVRSNMARPDAYRAEIGQLTKKQKILLAMIGVLFLGSILLVLYNEIFDWGLFTPAPTPSPSTPGTSAPSSSAQQSAGGNCEYLENYCTGKVWTENKGASNIHSSCSYDPSTGVSTVTTIYGMPDGSTRTAVNRFK